jgi:hypothetical protein
MTCRLGAAIAVLAFVAAPAYAHKGNPDYESKVTSVTPAVKGLRVSVLGRDDRLEVRNTTGRTVLIRGYSDEPYARLLPGGDVQVNQRSPANYLNEERDANVEVPDSADEKAAPQWRTIDGTGHFEWHDHRAHWMGAKRPEKVTDPDKRTRVFSWKVAIDVGGRPGRIAGVLDWTPRPGGGPPAGAIAVLALVAVGGGALVVAVRRRRSAGADAPEDEAW